MNQVQSINEINQADADMTEPAQTNSEVYYRPSKILQ